MNVHDENDVFGSRVSSAAVQGELPHAIGVELPAKPMAINDRLRCEPAPQELKPLAARKTVCVVDDDPMMLDVLVRILPRNNFEL
jgi:hypothetical protein